MLHTGEAVALWSGPSLLPDSLPVTGGAALFPCRRNTADLFRHRSDNDMELCDECARLQGRSAQQAGASGMTLVGVGECEGVVAIEHYRCSRCSTVMHRQFTGGAQERIWRPIYRSG